MRAIGKLVRSGKIFGWILALFSMCLAPLLYGQESIFSYLQKMNGLYFIPILAVVLVGMLTRRVPPIAAKAALVAGFLVIACGYFVPPAALIVASMNDFHFLGVVFTYLVVMMLDHRRDLAPEGRVGADRCQGRGHDAVGSRQEGRLVLVLLVLAIYITFADLSVLS